MNVFVELHILQNFAPSCLNRDDTNAPKDCDFGGYRRARISSQCLKRSVRSNGTFSSLMNEELGVRTKLLPLQISKGLVEKGKPENEAQVISAAIASAIWGELDANGKSKVLVFVSKAEVDEVVNTPVGQLGADLQAYTGGTGRKEGQEGKGQGASADRMRRACEELLT